MKKLFFTLLAIIVFSVTSFANENNTCNESSNFVSFSEIKIKKIIYTDDKCETFHVVYEEHYTTAEGFPRVTYHFGTLTICIDKVLA